MTETGGASRPLLEDDTVEGAARSGLISQSTFDALSALELTKWRLRDIAIAALLPLGDAAPTVARELVAAALSIPTDEDDISSRSADDAATTDDATNEAGPSRQAATAQHDGTLLRSLFDRGVLGVRVYNTLVTSRLLTVGDVRALPLEQLLALRNFGARSLGELRAAGVLSDRSSTDRTERIRPSTSAEYRDLERWRVHHSVVGESSHDAAPKVPAAPMPVDEHPLDDAVAEPDAEIGQSDDASTIPVADREMDLGALLTFAHRELSHETYQVLARRPAQTLEEIGRTMGVTRERVRQIEARGQRRLSALSRVAPALLREWEAALSRGIVSEASLFASHVSPSMDIGDQLEFGRILLRAACPRARAARVFGESMSGYWMEGYDHDLGQRLAEFAEFGPYRDEELLSSLESFGLDPHVGAVVLSLERSPLVSSHPAHGWVRRRAQVRDACFLMLERAGRPLRGELLARVLGVSPARNVAAQLERDDRFRRDYARRAWCLTTWDGAVPISRYRNTKQAMLDVLRTSGPFAFDELAARVRAIHPVSSWAVHNWLEDEAFGRFADGRYGMAYQGAVVHEDTEPAVDPGVQLRGAGVIAFLVRVTDDVLRGSGLGIPRYVTWFVGVRRVPRSKRFTRDEGPDIVVTRRPGFASISSLRHDAERLSLTRDCLLEVELDTASNTAKVRAVCPCHSSSDASTASGLA